MVGCRPAGLVVGREFRPGPVAAGTGTVSAYCPPVSFLPLHRGSNPPSTNP